MWKRIGEREKMIQPQGLERKRKAEKKKLFHSLFRLPQLSFNLLLNFQLFQQFSLSLSRFLSSFQPSSSTGIVCIALLNRLSKRDRERPNHKAGNLIPQAAQWAPEEKHPHKETKLSHNFFDT